MTEQERPRTEAGRELLRMGHTDVENILAIEAEGRQQAEGDWVGPFDGLSLQRHYNPATGKLWHYDDCPDEDHRFDLHAILDRVAGLNASESPPTEDRCDWIEAGQPYPNECGRTLPCSRHSTDHEGHPFGFTDLASESGQPPEASHD